MQSTFDAVAGLASAAVNSVSREEIQLGQHSLLVTERLAEGGFGFIDMVQNVNTGQSYAVS